MISSESRYRIWGCLTPSPVEPDLHRYFEERAADLVTSLATHLLHTGTQEERVAFCGNHGIDEALLPVEMERIAPGNLPPEERLQRMVAFLIRDYRLLEEWIRVTKGEEYLTLLFGTYRPVPWFGDEACIAVRSCAEPGEIPLRGMLVDDGKTLRIAREEAVREETGVRALLEYYPDYFLWVLVFTA